MHRGYLGVKWGGKGRWEVGRESRFLNYKPVMESYALFVIVASRIKTWTNWEGKKGSFKKITTSSSQELEAVKFCRWTKEHKATCLLWKGRGGSNTRLIQGSLG